MKSVRGPLTEVQQINILLEEYAVLYGLLQWRLAASDRRMFVAGALLAGMLASVHTLDAASARLLLWGLPLVLWVIFSATLGHARSKEDLLRRIDEIERQVNVLADAELLAFQSQRLRLDRAVGGRTGVTAINGTLLLCIALLLGAAIFLWPWHADETALAVALGYALWVMFWALLMLRMAFLLRDYRYERPVLMHSPDGQ